MRVWSIVAFIKQFIVFSILTIVLCLIGHLYIFLELTWHNRAHLGLTIAFNAAWYCWWAYSFIVVLSYMIEKKAEIRAAG